MYVLKPPLTIGTFDGAAQCAPGEWRDVRQAPRGASLVIQSVPL